ncbi:hypothetical protein ACU4GR_10340 (plasmid) [Methylobacterium oryzae CBMB20]
MKIRSTLAACTEAATGINQAGRSDSISDPPGGGALRAAGLPVGGRQGARGAAPAAERGHLLGLEGRGEAGIALRREAGHRRVDRHAGDALLPVDPGIAREPRLLLPQEGVEVARRGPLEAGFGDIARRPHQRQAHGARVVDAQARQRRAHEHHDEQAGQQDRAQGQDRRLRTGAGMADHVVVDARMQLALGRRRRSVARLVGRPVRHGAASRRGGSGRGGGRPAAREGEQGETRQGGEGGRPRIRAVGRQHVPREVQGDPDQHEEPDDPQGGGAPAQLREEQGREGKDPADRDGGAEHRDPGLGAALQVPIRLGGQVAVPRDDVGHQADVEDAEQGREDQPGEVGGAGLVEARRARDGGPGEGRQDLVQGDPRREGGGGEMRLDREDPVHGHEADREPVEAQAQSRRQRPAAPGEAEEGENRPAAEREPRPQVEQGRVEIERGDVRLHRARVGRPGVEGGQGQRHAEEGQGGERDQGGGRAQGRGQGLAPAPAGHAVDQHQDEAAHRHRAPDEPRDEPASGEGVDHGKCSARPGTSATRAPWESCSARI